MTTNRLVEATQFTIQDYEVFKTGTKFDNKYRQAAMEQMAKDEKDPKSELNKLGMKEVRRIRVLRDSADTEGTNLTLVYETKTDKRTLQTKAWQEDQKKAENMRYSFPFWMPDVKAHFKSVIEQLVGWVDAHPILSPDIARKLEEISKSIVESKLDRETLTQARVDIYRLLNANSQGILIYPAKSDATSDEEYQKLEEVQKLNQEKDAKSEFFALLDYLAASLLVLRTGLIDKESLLKYSKNLLPPRPPRPPQGKPEQRRDTQKKDRGPQRKPNGNHARSQGAGPQVEKKPESAQA